MNRRLLLLSPALAALFVPALSAAAQDATGPEAEEIEAVIGDAVANPGVPSDLPVTLPDPSAVPPADPARRLDTPDAVFIADALRAGEMEIAAAKLAQDRSGNDELKLLAERIEDDHERLNDRLRGLQDADAATEPRGDPAHPEAPRLEALEDAAFDAAWLAVAASHLDVAIGKFERAGSSPALDVDLRSAAAEALVTLRGHADAVADLRDSLGYE